MLLKALFSGRMNRQSWFVANLLIGVGLLIFALITRVIILGNLEQLFLFHKWLQFILIVFVIIFSYSISIRRLHDIGVNGWLILIELLPLINILFVFYLLFAPGEKKNNKYGQKPQNAVKFF